MIPFIFFIILFAFEIALSFNKKLHYRNVDAVFFAFAVWIAEIIACVAAELIARLYNDIPDIYSLMFLIQAVGLITVKLRTKKKDSLIRYGIPRKYTNGFRFKFINKFYEFDDKSPHVYAKTMTPYIGLAVFVNAVILAVIFGIQYYRFYKLINTLLLPVAAVGLISLLIEFSIFCNGESLWQKLMEKFNMRIGCANRREFAKARYSYLDDYEYIFVKNHVWEENHITHATKMCWRDNPVLNAITYYDFSDKSTKDYNRQENNPALEEFIRKNGLEVNNLYVAAYNLIDKNQNVMIKTPSYVDFLPYFTALVKMKVAKSQKIVLVVSNEEKKNVTVGKLQNSFEEFFGFQNIPVIRTIDDCIKILRDAENQEQKQGENRKKYSHFLELTELEGVKDAPPEKLPEKEADIIVAAPEDVCNPTYVDLVQDIIKKLGLIVYYDFSDCVQEEALFARIVHSVLDYSDSVSTLYMSDGFFDLEQVLDNFFSERNLYCIDVPRKPSPVSYVTGWKAENINEMQARTVSDASRNIGNHIPVLYDGSSTTVNDFMVIEDEYDAYAENYSNIVQDSISSRLDCHVGWTDILGGNSVYCTVSDTYNNAAHTYKAVCGIGVLSEYINIISRPYLLRNYLMYHLKYFAENIKVLNSYSPGLIRTPRAIAYEACVKAHIAGCSSGQLLKYATMAALDCGDNPEEILSSLIKIACGIDDVDKKTISISFGRYYIDYAVYKQIIDNSGFVEKIEFINNNKVIIRSKKEFPCLIPQQKIVLNGVKYTVESIDGNRVEITDSNVRESLFVNRAVRTCKAEVKKCDTYSTLVQHGSKSSIQFKSFICDVNMTTHGNIVFKDSYHPLKENSRFDYHEVPEKQAKYYKGVNMFCIKLSNPLINASNKDKLAHLLAILLNEMLPTFFPRCSERILVGCSGWTVEQDLDTEKISPLNIAVQMDVDDPQPPSDNEICLYILEDSPIETGLVNVFWQDEEFKYMLKILEDYLYYQEMIRREEFKDIFSESYKSLLHLLRKVLLQVINETLDVPGGDEAPYYFNSIRRSRNKFNRLDLHNHFDMTCDFCGKKIETKSGQPIKYHFYSYSGMISCMPCYLKAVCAEKTSQADVKQYQLYINKWFSKRYNETVDNLFYNYLEDAEFLADEVGAHNKYIVTDDFDGAGIAGLSSSGIPGNVSTWKNPEYIPVTSPLDRDKDTDEAVLKDETEKADTEITDAEVAETETAQTEAVATETEERYDFVDDERAAYQVSDEQIAYILIKDGLAYKNYMSVLCHEMTHQWQFNNLDNSKLTASVPSGNVDEFGKSVVLDSYRLEGHAEWERIQYLKSHWAWFKAMKEIASLKVRLDDYGYGYRWMARMMRVGRDDLSIPADRTFSFKMKRNFYQLTNNSFALMRLYFGKATEGPESTVVETSEVSETTETTDTTETPETPKEAEGTNATAPVEKQETTETQGAGEETKE